MSERYTQPYASAQLNSCLPIDVEAAGKLDWKFKFNAQDVPGTARFLHLVDDQRALLDFDEALFLIDLVQKNVSAFRNKTDNSFITLIEEGRFYYLANFSLIRADVDSFDQKPEGMFLPNMGPSSAIFCFAPQEEGFFAGVQFYGSRGSREEWFDLYKRPYHGVQISWQHRLPGRVVKPPLSTTGDVVITREDTLVIINYETGSSKEITGKFAPLGCSIGNDKLIYLACATSAGPRLQILDLAGQKQKEITISSAELRQPPIIGLDSTAYLVGATHIEAIRGDRVVWTFALSSESPKATVSGNGFLLVSDGSRIACLGKDGVPSWIYVDTDNEMFLTPPVLNSAGQLFIASDQSIAKIE